MGKVKHTAMAGEHAAHEESHAPAVIVFGRDEGGRSHASTFTVAEAELATRAAAFMGMQVLPITTGEHRAVASELPRGRIFESGKGFVPFVKEAAYGRLEAFPEAFAPAPAAEASAPRHTGVPAAWEAIEPGSLVLASEGAYQGHWEAIVVEAPGDGLFKLVWRDWPDLPPFVRRREHIALLTAELAALAEQAEEPAGEAAEAPVAEA